MNFKGIYYSLTFRLALAIGLTAALTYQALEKEWGWFLFLGIGWLAALRGISLLFKRNAQKVAFMFDASTIAITLSNTLPVGAPPTTSWLATP